MARRTGPPEPMDRPFIFDPRMRFIRAQWRGHWPISLAVQCSWDRSLRFMQLFGCLVRWCWSRSDKKVEVLITVLGITIALHAGSPDAYPNSWY